MTVACLRAVIHDKGGLAPPIHVLDALSGTGLRAIRMALEGEWLSIISRICNAACLVHPGFTRARTHKKCRLNRSRKLRGLKKHQRHRSAVPDVSSVHANEGLPSSFRTLERNFASHARAVSDAGARLETTMLEAGLMMSTAGRRYHFVDVDPCGSPAELLHGALACLCDGGVLSACFFDLQSLTGTGAAASTCFPKYGSMPLTPRQGRGFEREAAVRIATHAVMRHAEEQGMGIEPLLCVYCETCVRVVVRVSVAQGEAGVDGLVQAGADADRPFMSNGGSSTRSLAEMDQCTDGIGGEERGGGEKGGSGGRGGGRGGGTGVGRSIRVHACSLCPSYTIQDAATGLPHPLAECQQCSTKGQGEVGGPMWGGELCSPSFVENLVKQTSSLSTGTRIAALATSCASEHMCTPLFSDIYAVFAAFGVPSPPRDAVMDALRRAGLKCTVSHASATGIKTSGDASVVYDLARVWMEGRPGGFQQGGNVVARRKRRECQQGGGIFAHMTYHKLFGKEIGGRDDEEEANRVCGDQSTVFAGSLTEREVRDSDFDVDDVGCGAAEGWGSTRNASGESRREIGKRKEGCGTGQGVGMNRRQRRALMKQAAGQTGSEPGNGDESIIIGDKQAMDGRGDAEIAYAGPNSVATLPGNGKVEESIGSSGATGDAAGVTRRVEAGGSISQILSCARHGDTIVVASGKMWPINFLFKRETSNCSAVHRLGHLISTDSQKCRD
jgi:tRNA G26 N,N-dimethylase Trm1